jgi:glycerol kinase
VKSYIGAIDQGTTSTRFMVFDKDARVVAMAQKEHQQIFPEPGWVEHNAEEILRRTHEVIAGALQQRGLQPSDLAAIGITNQRETTVVWERKSGRPVTNAIVWQDTRVGEEVARFAKTGGQDRFRAKTGLPLSTYFSGLKLRWILQNVAGAREKAAGGELLFGNIDTFLAWNLTGGPRGGAHVTDVTNASRTQLMNLRTLDWDEELLSAFEIPRAMLPEVRSSSEEYGVARLPAISGVPVAGILGDQQAALVGQACFRPGEVKNTYGTGCFLLMNTGERMVESTCGRAAWRSLARWCSGCATVLGSLQRVPTSRRWRERWKITVMCILCRRFPVCMRRIGKRTRGELLPGLRVMPIKATWRVRF